MDNEQQITTDIKVPNKNMEVLKKHFGQCFDKNGNFDIEKFKQELSENEIDFYKESYGLDWLGKSYARILASDEATTLLKEDEEHNQKDENKDSGNLLIKGDNLEVLKHLSNAYYEKIKMIYIDPPYNTGSDGFVYQDNRKFTIDELKNLAGVDEEKAKRILEFTQSKSNSHSAWLTFMYPRLYIAKQLLKEDGVIFISIDDNEVAQLKLLMDEIFGEEHFIANIIWEKRYGRSNNAKLMTNSTEHILLYRKTEKLDILREARKNDTSGYSNSDNDPRGAWTSVSFINQVTREERPNLSYSITNPNTGKIINHPTNAWKVSEENYSKLQKENRLHWGNDGKAKYPRIKRFLSELDKGMVPVNFWSFKDAGSVDLGTKRIKDLFGFDAFTFPKPTQLIKKMLTLFNPNEKDYGQNIILDFFAGSGTTGDAVVHLNAEDGGNRKYILVQLPELIDKKKNKTAYDFVKDELNVTEPTIFEITKERLVRASKKLKEETIVSKIADKEKEIAELNGKLDLENKEEKIQQLKAEIENLKNQDLGFQIFETTPIWDDYGFEADELNPELELFDESTLSEEDIKALLITWKTYDGIGLTENLIETDFGGYNGYFTNEKLYLMDKGFSTDNLKNLLEKIDTDKKFNPTTIVAFGYNFDSKNLREISENIKSYANKKNIDINFITRY